MRFSMQAEKPLLWTLSGSAFSPAYIRELELRDAFNQTGQLQNCVFFMAAFCVRDACCTPRKVPPSGCYTIPTHVQREREF